ncbi:MAG: hypothetical protein AAFN08_04630, partial [Cyanobacteria bacterium J06559_3]
IDIALAPNPLELLSTHDDQTLRCWRPIEGSDHWLPYNRLQVPTGALMSAVIASPLGQYRAIGTEAGTVHIWQVSQQQWLSVPIYLPNSISALIFNADETVLAIGDATGNVAMWHLMDSRFGWQQPQAHADKITALALAPDGRLFSGSRDRTIQGWDTEGNRITTLTEHRRRVHTLCLSADGKTLYSGSYDFTVCCWDLSTHTCNHTWQRSDNSGDRLIHCVVRDAQNRVLAIVSDTQSLEVWDLDTDTCCHSLPPHHESIWHVSISPDGKWLVSASHAGEINIWTLASSELQGQLRVDRPYEAMQIAGCTGLTDSERLMLRSLGATEY